MRSLSADAWLADVAALLARAYRRLTQKACNDATFLPVEPQNCLDVLPRESECGREKTALIGGLDGKQRAR